MGDLAGGQTTGGPLYRLCPKCKGAPPEKGCKECDGKGEVLR